jgi:colanic acid biosynthesis glycosyl transferase WcaI
LRIIFICQWFPPEYAPIGIMLRELAEDLIQHGHVVTVITGFPNHPGGIIFKGYHKKLICFERMDGIRVFRCYLYTSPKKTFLRRILNFVTFASTSFATGLFINRQDLLFIVSPPLSSGLIALLLFKLRGLRFVFNVQDLYPDAAISTGIIKNSLFIKILKKLELTIYRQAEKIAVISDGFKENLLLKGVADKKIKVIQNWIDTDEIIQLPRDNEFTKTYGLKDKFVVLYSGTIGMISGAEILIECAKELRTYEEILFLLIGEGVVKDEISKKAKAIRLRNIKLLPFQRREILSQVLSSADVSIVTLLKGKGKTSVPSKILGYMAAGRPVIASVDSDSDTCRLIEKANCGICVKPEDIKGLCTAIESFYHDREKGRVLGNNGRNFIESNFYRRTITGRYETLFSECHKA